MASVNEQTAVLNRFLQEERYADAYRYIATQIAGDLAWNQLLVVWFNDAAYINGTDSNFLKKFVFTYNALRSLQNPNDPNVIAQNQEVSDRLAERIINDYLEKIQNGSTLSPADIMARDINELVKGFNVPKEGWSGGPLAVLYGFPIDEIYETLDDYASWAKFALGALDYMAEDFAREIHEFLMDSLQALRSLMQAAATEAADAINDLIDLIRDALSDPLILDLDGDGIELVSLAQSATQFDLDGDGALERTGWVGPQDGFLVQDANGNGLIDGVGELFGSANVDGFDELRALDSNGDGKIDASDPAFSQLRVWRDLNSDGQSTPDEMQTLADAGIVSFGLGYTQVDQDIDGNIVARTGSYVRADGNVRSMGSVNFALEEILPAPTDSALLGDLILLPNLSGQLGLTDLRTAMYNDPVLKAMVEDLTYGDHGFDTFAEFRDGGFLEIIYR